MDKKTTVKIHGKEYEIVGSRVHRFRSDHKDWSIQTEILSQTVGEIIVRANIADEKNTIRATGIAHEKEGASSINKTSYVECAETSAIGRALACLDYQGGEFASADEVAQAIHQQKDKPEPAKTTPAPTQQTATQPAQDKTVISEKQVGFFFGKGKEFGWSTEELKTLINTFGYEHTKNIKRDDFKKIIEMIEKGIPNIPHDEKPAYKAKFKKEMIEETAKNVVTDDPTPLQKKMTELKNKLDDDIAFSFKLNEMYGVDDELDLDSEQMSAFCSVIANMINDLEE